MAATSTRGAVSGAYCFLRKKPRISCLGFGLFYMQDEHTVRLRWTEFYKKGYSPQSPAVTTRSSTAHRTRTQAPCTSPSLPSSCSAPGDDTPDPHCATTNPLPHGQTNANPGAGEFPFSWATHGGGSQPIGPPGNRSQRFPLPTSAFSSIQYHI